MKCLWWNFLGVLLFVGCRQNIEVNNLTCDYRTNPIAIENETPFLGWQIVSGERNVSQQAYRILVADDERLLDKNIGNIWDSEKVMSDHSVQVAYSGETLKPYKSYYWKVKIWDNQGRETAWSQTAQWRQVLKNPEMKWMGYANPNDRVDCVGSIWFRKKCFLENIPTENVYADISTPGYYELYINGKKVGNDVLSPSVAGKDKRSFYVTYDIKKYLRKGENIFAIWLGKGWYGMGPIPVAFHCEIPQKEGNIIIDGDNSWKVSASCYSTLGSWDWSQFGGECYDARYANSEWNLLKFDDSAWSNAQVLPQPSPVLEAQPCELNRENSSIRYKSITALEDDCYEIDFGTALTGRYKITFPSLQRGDTVMLYFSDVRWNSPRAVNTPAGVVRECGGESLFRFGKDTVRYTTYNQHSMYIAAGEGEEVFESKFNPLGFRYIIVRGLKEKPLDAVAFLVETDLKLAGSFDCSDTLLMRMHKINDWTMRCLNQGAVYVDCPTRERLGYGDGQVSVESSIMNYYMPLFYRKFVKDWVLRQDKTTGAMPNVAPNYQGGGGPGWAGLVAAITWRNYLYYEDSAFLKEIYPSMMLYLKNFESRCVDGIFRSGNEPWQSIGDWVPPGRGMDTNNWPSKEMAEFFNNCYRVYLWDIQRQAAQVLGKTEDIVLCTNKLGEIRPLIHNAFYNEQTGCYVSEEQTYLIMPLMTGVVPDSLKNQLWEKLEANIEEKGVLETGMFGTYFLIQYLQESERSDLLYRLVAHERYPGWGYMLSQDATVWWEQWNGFFSHMHSCFTSLDSWFYQGIAGIRVIPEYGGMKRFKIKPAYALPIQNARASIRNMYGEIQSSWEKDGDRIILNVTIPANSSAEIWFPTGNKNMILEKGTPLDAIKDFVVIDNHDKETVCLVPSGHYEFQINGVEINSKGH